MRILCFTYTRIYIIRPRQNALGRASRRNGIADENVLVIKGSDDDDVGGIKGLAVLCTRPRPDQATYV